MIYRGHRLINWCPKCGTSLSDAEVEHVDRDGKYWYFRYPAAKEGGMDITVATSRPETMFGDVAIAVNPEDERYKEFIGQKVLIPLVNREIPIIADPYPDSEKEPERLKLLLLTTLTTLRLENVLIWKLSSVWIARHI